DVALRRIFGNQLKSYPPGCRLTGWRRWRLVAWLVWFWLKASKLRKSKRGSQGIFCPHDCVVWAAGGALTLHSRAFRLSLFVCGKFPVPQKIFPVRTSREFRSKPANSSPESSNVGRAQERNR